MPYIDLLIHPAPAPATAARLAAAATRAMGALMGKREAVTAVNVRGVPGALWTIGGQVPELTTAYVDVKITAGTNSAAQKAELIAHLHAQLTTELGPLAEASYIVVHELPATDWGYAGRTQAARMAAAAAPHPSTPEPLP